MEQLIPEHIVPNEEDDAWLLHALADVDEDAVESTDNEKKQSVNKVAAGKRGRKAKDRSNLKIPKDKFTMKQLELLNPEVSFALLYQHIRALLNIEYKIVESIGGKRGKPTLVYAPIDMVMSNWIFGQKVK